MPFPMPITRRRIQSHFQYGFWKYLVLAALAIFGWNLLYTTTRYRPPESAKVEFYAEGSSASDTAVQALADRIHAEVMPQMEEVSSTVVTFDDMYGDMQLTVWVSAGQGDVYLLSKERFLTLASSEALLDLTPYLQSGALSIGNLDVSAGYVRGESGGEPKLLGIPADSLTGFAAYGLSGEGRVLCLLVNGGNDEYAVKFLNALLNDVGAPTP